MMCTNNHENNRNNNSNNNSNRNNNSNNNAITSHSRRHRKRKNNITTTALITTTETSTSTAAAAAGFVSAPEVISAVQGPQVAHRRRIAGTKAGSERFHATVANILLTTSIILLLCCPSHVLAIRKGRLMSPSSFVALSGDLHVQIQYNVGGGEESPVGVTAPSNSNTSTVKSTPTTITPTTTMIASSTRRTFEWHLTEQTPSVAGRQDTLTSTLVISKFIDETDQSPNTDVEDLVLLRRRKEIVQNIPLYPDPRRNITQIAVPCQTFVSGGGLYEMQVVTNLRSTTTAELPAAGDVAAAVPTLITTTLMPVDDERLRQTLDVRWPSADMQVDPLRLRTYPERPVAVVLRFPEVNCDSALRSAELPEFWLELVYCGKERTCGQLSQRNSSNSHVLYAEQVRGFPKYKKLQLGCELFGLAGHYAVQLRPMRPAGNVPTTRRYISVDWSDKFVFNVYARSVFPCDPHTGIGVLYEYPGCILEQGDRVRVYAKLRADVASLKPPTSLHYVAEQRVVKSQHSLYFSCDLFTEKYVEYCFVYVSQAISGAVADVRMDCVPTLPVSDSDTGGWGPWSEWTPCSTNCLGGTRNRYRFCDSPPPRYGAKFCEGSSVETEKCGAHIANTWDCIYATSGVAHSIQANRTEVSQEIGPGCRCGCIVHLGSSKPKRIIAGATQSCPGRSFWLIQVDGEENIVLSLNFLRLPCVSQYIKVRDGPSLSSTLLIELSGEGGISGEGYLNMPAQLESAGAQLLLEFYAGDRRNSSGTTEEAANAVCTGGFLADVVQIGRNSTPTTLLAATRLLTKSRTTNPKSHKQRSKFTLVHLSAVIFASIIILISALLGAQYVVRYRKYHLAVSRRQDEGSRLHTPRASLSSLHRPPSRAMSTTTLLSEVIYLVKMRPKHQLRHSILRESIDAEHMARETEFAADDGGGIAQLSKCDEEAGSNGSLLTLRNEIVAPAMECSYPSVETVGFAEGQEHDIELGSSHSGTLTRKDSAKDAESIISSGMSSIYNSPPMYAKRLSKYSERYDVDTLKAYGPHLGETNALDSDSLRSREYECVSHQRSHRSVSASLMNDCISPTTSSGVSTTTTRITTNPKESKEKQNRRKLLARPGSEFSLGNQEELEMDYYDYNVINAGAAPGSYLGMDPAYLVWIPPFEGAAIIDAEGESPEKTPEPEETELLYDQIRVKMPRYGHYLSPRSNSGSCTNTPTNTTATPTPEETSPLSSSMQSKATSPTDASIVKHRTGQRSPLLATVPKQPTPYLTRKKRRAAKQQSKSALSLRHGTALDEDEMVPLQELSATKSAREISREATATISSALVVDPMTGSYVEKETSVVKSPSDLQNFLALDDIQFADEGDVEHEARQKTSRHMGGMQRSSGCMAATTSTVNELSV